MSDTLTRARLEHADDEPGTGLVAVPTVLASASSSGSSAAASLRAQPAGWGIIRRCLELQSAARSRGRVRRVFGVDPLHPDAVPWFQAGVGEQELGRVLDRLGAEWTVLHGVPAGARGREIDHLLIGPAGVIAVDIIHVDSRVVIVEGDTIVAGSTRVGLVHDVLEEREDAASRLSVALAEPVEVTSLIVVVGADRVVVRAHPTVQVVTPDEFGRLLERVGGKLTRDRVRAVAAIAERPEHWQPQLPAPVGTATLPDRFDELRREVTSARRRRDAWSIGGLVVAVSAFWTSLLMLSPDAVPRFVQAIVG